MSLINKDGSTLPSINFELENYDELFDNYRTDLESYIKTFSGIRSENVSFAKRFLLSKLEEKWLPLLDFNSSRIQSDIRELQAPKTDFITSMSLKDLLSHDDGNSDWLIPNFLSSTGLYLLAGEPKTGKTILLNFLIYAVSVSGEFLGKPTQTGSVLYLQLEESLKTMKKRALMSGFGNETDEETSLVINFSDRVKIERVFDLSSDIDWLVKKILETKPKLVIVDSLRMASMKSEAGENTNEFGKMMYALQKAVNFAGTCCVVVHHMNKGNGKNVSLIKSLAGHTSISAASDGIIGLISEEDEDGRMIVLKTLPRDGVPITIYYRLEKGDNGLWKINKIYEDNPGSSVYTSRILRYLGQHSGEFFTPTQIAREIESHSKNKEFNQALDYLDNSEILTKKYIRQSLMYGLSADSLWIVNPERVKDMVSTSIIDANSLMRCISKRQIRELVKEWDKDRETAALKCLFDGEKARIKSLIHSWEFAIGDGVIYDNNVYIIDSLDGDKGSLNSNRYFLSDIEGSVFESELDYPEEVEEAITLESEIEEAVNEIIEVIEEEDTWLEELQ